MLRRLFAPDTRMPRLITFTLIAITLLIARTGFAQSRASGSDAFTLLVTDSGNVWSFGDNSSGQLGLGNTTDSRTPQQVPGLSNVIAVAAGRWHALALTATGDLFAWGSSGEGQIGNGSNTDSSSPVQLSLASVVAIAAGRYHSLALTATGDLYAWGDNFLGQLGTGDQLARNTPMLIVGGISALGAGDYHSLAVKTDGSAWAWGLSGGRLGNNVATSGATTAPVQMIGISNAVAVDGGSDHSVILLSDGTLKATGSNAYGQLGNGTNTTSYIPVSVIDLTNIQTVAVGADHNLALDADGFMWVWGHGSKGALGTGNQTDVDTPVNLSSPTDVEYIGVGMQQSIAIDENGIVSTWGSDESGELGDGTTINRYAPDAISASGYSWRVSTPRFSVAAGTYHAETSVIVTADTADSTIHYTVDGSDPTGSHPTVSSGSSVTIDQSRTLKAKAWKTGMPDSAIGSAAYTLQPLTPDITPAGGSGLASSQTVSMSPNTSGSTIRYTLNGTDPTASSTAYTAPFAIDATTTIKSAAFITGWSMSGIRTATFTFNYGPLDPPSMTPAPGNYAGTVSVTMSSTQSGATIRYTTNGSTPTASSTAYSSPLQITQTTTVKAKAFHSSYATSAETSRTYTMSAATPALSVATGSYAPGGVVTISTSEPTATLRMTIDGNDPTSSSTIVSSGTSLLLGNFTLKVKAFRSGVADSAIASAAYTLTSALGPGAVTTGGGHNVLATPDGRVYVWGDNLNGQLGNESTTDRQTPTLLHTITGVTSVASGLAHTLALTWDGQVYAWGSNGSGRLGNSSTNQSTRPVHVSTLSNVVAIAAGDTHSLALTSDGHVYSWGANTTGQLGLGNSGAGTEQIVPTQITTLSNIVAIAAGDTDSFAVTSSGQVYAWGANGNSRLGGGGTDQQNSPLLLGLSNIVSIAAGQAHTLALTSAGRVYGWGANGNGQLGFTPATTVATPTLIASFHASAIAAGDNHSGAIRADGVLVMWGNSPSGQVGTGSTTATVSTPTAVTGPSGVSTLSLGDLHSVAVTSTGEVWAWGESADYRLGNGNSSQDKSSPQSVFTGLTSWAAAAPTINVPSATLSGSTTVTLTSSTSGAVIRYTLNGTIPTGSDAEIPANGQIEISYSSLLRARAFVTGRQPGVSPARADYQLQSAAPEISPGTGTYTSAQNVSITATGAPGAIRYTVDGTEPSAASSLYSAPLAVSTGMTIKAKTFPSNGWSPSPAASAVLSFNYGTLSTPTASLAEGVYADAQSVTLGGPSGAIIRYTTNGADPTAVSNVYVTPVEITSGAVTLKVRAFHADWSQSPVLSRLYTIDAAAPTITWSRFPAAVGGWHNTPTTVSFTCQDNVGISSCSSPSAVSSEGLAQEVVGTATDLAGRQANVTVTVNVDLTAPSVAITAPSSGLTTSDSSVELAGTVTDSLSGIVAATCNGQSATVVSGGVSCTVAVGPGRNDVILAARDAAGNVTSKSVRITRIGTSTAIGLTPSTRTLLVDEATSFTLTDEFGTVVTGAAWSSSDPAIVSVSIDDPPMLTALQSGSATITATKNNLTATATLSVVAGTSLAYGTTRWGTSGAPGFTVAQSIVANRIDLSVPDLFSVEWAGTSAIVRGVTAAGDVTWVASSPGLPIMADSFGGLVAGTFASYAPGYGGNQFTDFIRFGGPDGTYGWRYESRGTVSRPAQAPDGTIYTVERYEIGVDNPNGLAIVDTQVLVIDGVSGAVRARYPLARERFGSNCGTYGNVEVAPDTLGFVVGIDGYGYLLVRRRTANLCAGPISMDVGIDLLRVSPSGAVTTTAIYSEHCDPVGPSICDLAPELKEIFPDGIGGTLVRAFRYTGFAYGEGYSGETRLIRVANGSIQFTNVTDPDERITMIGDAGTAFVAGDDLRAMDVTNWTLKWSNSNTSLAPVLAMPNGKAAMNDVTSGQLIELNEAGVEVSTAPLNLVAPVQTRLGLWTGIDHASGLLAAKAALPLNEATVSFNSGSATLQNAPGERSSATRNEAVIAVFDWIFTEPLASGAAKFEYGGLICKDGNRFRWSEIRTDQIQDQVTVPDTLCPPGTIAAHYHTHPPLESPVPSGNDRSDLNPPQPLGGDYNNARTHPGIPYYLRAPIPNSPVWPPKETHTLKYWWTGTGALPSQNVCKRLTNGSWAPYTELSPNANCATPNP